MCKTEVDTKNITPYVRVILNTLACDAANKKLRSKIVPRKAGRLNIVSFSIFVIWREDMFFQRESDGEGET